MKHCTTSEVEAAALVATLLGRQVTWHARPQGHEGYGIHAILEADCAAQMGGDVTDKSRDNANEKYRNPESDPSEGIFCGGST